MSMVAEPISISALAVLTGMDRRTVAKRMAGVDHVGMSGRAKLYSPPAALKAIFIGDQGEKPLDLNHESARLRKAQADKTELEVEVLKGTLLESDDVEELLADQKLTARASFLSIPPRLAMQVKSMADEPLPAIEDVISEAIHAALQSLADGRVKAKIKSSVGSTTKTNSKRVVGSKQKPKSGKRGRGRAV